MIYDNGFGGYFPQQNPNQYNYQNFQNKNSNQPIGGSFIWVNSRKEAEEYPLGANGAIMMMNRNEKYFYLKSCDGFGMVQSFKAFPYTEETSGNTSENKGGTTVDSEKDYVSRQEFEELKAEFEKLKPSKKVKETESNDK